MAALGKRSLFRLTGSKPVTIQRAQMLAQLLTNHGGDFGIAEYGGMRDDALQAQLVQWRDDSVAAGHPSYAVAPAGHSNHATGDAFDIELNTPARGLTDDATLHLLAQLAPTIGLRSGYFFKNKDEYHFENVEVSPHGPTAAALAAVVTIAADATAVAASVVGGPEVSGALAADAMAAALDTPATDTPGDAGASDASASTLSTTDAPGAPAGFTTGEIVAGIVGAGILFYLLVR